MKDTTIRQPKVLSDILQEVLGKFIEDNSNNLPLSHLKTKKMEQKKTKEKFIFAPVWAEIILQAERAEDREQLFKAITDYFCQDKEPSFTDDTQKEAWEKIKSTQEFVNIVKYGK